MTRRLATAVAVMAMAAAACSTLGLGDPDCTPPERNIPSSHILTLQAVPTAKYTPCVHELRLGWDTANWYAREGEAGIELYEGASAFLKAMVVESCDPGDATRVASGYPDIERFEATASVPVEIGITIVVSGSAARLSAFRAVSGLSDTQIEDRPIDIIVDEDESVPVPDRVARAIQARRHVWVISELAAAEGRMDLRSYNQLVHANGISPEDALDLIEDQTEETFYRGNWYFTFDGGCIVYEFDAHGAIAETVAADVEDALGFYPAYKLRDLADEAGFDIIDDDTED